MKPTPEQLEIIGSWGEGVAVMAGAGCGKTSTLVAKCEALLARDPEARFAAVSFTERSASDLREKLIAGIGSAGGGGGDLSRHTVTTIHGLCGSILREFPREAGYDGEESVLGESEAELLWERATEGLWFEDLPDAVRSGLEKLLDRETQSTLADLLRRLKALQSQHVLESLEQQEDPHALALLSIGRYVLDRYERAKRRRGAIDFDDLEWGADRALESREVRALFNCRFDLVLVDEFQDTNAVQARIIRKFVRPDLSNLCVVGDPKQSIYRFRDADVTLFEEFCAKLPKRLSLTRNFRCRPRLIELTNRTCEPAFDRSAMRYEPLVAVKEESNAFDPVLRLDLDSPATLAAWVRAEQAKGVPLESMALLLRKIRGNEHWLKGLTAAGVPLAVGSGGLFWSDPRVRELASLLKWWDCPAHKYSGAVFLRAPWVGIRDEELDAWNREDPSWQKPFFASTNPLAQALEPFRGKTVRPGEILLALLDSRAGAAIERDLGAQLLGLWHRVEDLSSRGLSFHAVVTELVTAMKESRRERDVPPPKNRGQLRVLTLHGAKGLEFDHVILIDLAGKQRAPNPPLLFWDRQEGAYLATRDEEGERNREDPVYAARAVEEKSRNLAETKRLFYVALTRAKERLVLGFPVLPEKAPPKRASKEKEPLEVFDEDNWRGWLETCGSLMKIEDRSFAGASMPFERNRDQPIPRAKPPAIPMKRARHSVTEWNLFARCPRAYEWRYIRPRLQKTREISSQKKSDATPIDQAELGSRVHQILERGDVEALKALEKEVGSERFSAESVIDWMKSSPLMRGSDVEQGREVWCELSFEAPIGDDVVVGSLDRLVREKTAEGPRYTIIDFKVTRALREPDYLTNAYQLQLDLYAWAVETLASEARGRVSAVIVNIAPDGVRTVPISVKPERANGILADVLPIIEGETAVPRPSEHCRVCEWNQQCDQSYG